MADNEPTDERNGVSRANEQVIRAIVRDELRGGEAGERDGGVTRREVLEAAGLVGVGALGGTTAMNEMVGTAEAATGTGKVGTEENPLDAIFANDIGSSAEPVQNLYTSSQTSLTTGSLDTEQVTTTDLEANKDGSATKVYIDAGTL